MSAAEVAVARKPDQDLIDAYELNLFGKDHVFISTGQSRLFVTSTAYNGRENYSAILSNTKFTEYDHLFLKDPTNGYYLDEGSGAYTDLVAHYVQRYGSQNVVFWGTSMSGYAALKWAFLFGSGAIVNCPQVNWDISHQYAWPDLKGRLAELKGYFVDLVDIPIKDGADIPIYYTHGTHPIDIANTSVLLCHLRNHRNVRVHVEPIANHLHQLLFNNFNEFKAAVAVWEALRDAHQRSGSEDHSQPLAL